MSKGDLVSARFAPSIRVRFVSEGDYFSTAIEIAAAHLPPALKIDTTLADAPDWVPRSVRLLAKQTLFKNDICQRLLTDTRLRPTWRWIMQQKIDDPKKRLDAFDDQGKLSKWGIDPAGTPLNDQICGAVFIATLNLLTVNHYTASRSATDREAAKWFDAASRCRDAQDVIVFGFADPKTIEALGIATERLERIGTSIKNENNPRVLGQESALRGNDLHKSHARQLALVMHHFFENYLYGTVAKLISVGLNVDPEITRKSTENWCGSLSPLKHKIS